MKNTNFNFFKNKKTQFKTALILGLLVFITMIGLSSYANSKVKAEISKIVGLECEKINVSILFSKATLSDLSYKWNEPKSDSSTIFCKNISLDGIQWWSLIVHKKLKIRELHIENVQGKIEQSILKKDSTITTTDKKPQLKSIFINKIFLHKVNIEYTRRKDFYTKMEDFQLQLNQLEYDLSKPLKAIKYTGFNYSLKKGSWIPKDGSYAINISSINGNIKDNSLLLQGLELQPLHSKKDWYKHFKYKKARLGLKSSNIVGTDINYKKLLNGEGLNMKNLLIENLNLDIHIDRKSPPCVDCYKPFIHEKLLETEFPITVNNIELKNNKIDLEIINEKNESAAKLNFDKIYATIYNVTNEKENIKTSPKITADIKTLFLGKENLDAKIIFNLDDNLNGYQLEGKMENMDLTTMNNILQFGTKAKINSGVLNQLNFKVNGNQKVATGTMAFNYENLKVEILNQKKSKSKKLISKLVNKITIKKDNVASEGNFKEGKIYYVRRKNKGIFHQWWRAIQSGFQSTILPNLLLPDELESK